MKWNIQTLYNVSYTRGQLIYIRQNKPLRCSLVLYEMATSVTFCLLYNIIKGLLLSHILSFKSGVVKIPIQVYLVIQKKITNEIRVAKLEPWRKEEMKTKPNSHTT